MYQRLYKKTPTGIQWWEAETQGDQLILRWARSMEGKVSQKLTSLTGKGKQKRTDEEQAEFVARSKINEQIDDGYVWELEHTEWPVTNSLGFPMPMLATAIDKVKNGGVQYPGCQMGPKLDGHRMMLGILACPHKVADPRYKADGEATLYSRGSQKIDLPHILKPAVAIAYENGLQYWPMDGEVYRHGTPLQDIKRLVARKDETLKWHLYDICAEDFAHTARRELLEKLELCDSIVLNPSHPVANAEESLKIHRQYVEQGYEGTILRWSAEGYKSDGRPPYLTKQKDFQDAEFEILELVQDKPHIDVETGQRWEVCSYICLNNDGSETTFKVTVEGDRQKKHDIWVAYMKDPDQFVGKPLKMAFHQRSKAGIPTVMTALGIREEL